MTASAHVYYAERHPVGAKLSFEDAVQQAVEMGIRVAKLEAALRDCIPFVAVHADKYRRDFGMDKLHETHAAILDRASTLTGGEILSTKLARKPGDN